MPRLSPTPKGYTVDQDKIRHPRETVAQAKAAFARFGAGLLAETRRIDTGRLGIPVYLSVCGEAARAVMIHTDSHRAYRQSLRPRPGETAFQVVVAQTDLYVVADRPLAREIADQVRELRAALTSFMAG